MFKNVASQKIMVFAFDSTTNLPKTGDSANITAYVSKDFGAVTVLTDTSATEIDATNAKGYYWFDVSQTETNADALIFSAKSSTANIVVIGVPAVVYTTPPNFTLQSIDSNGRLDVIKVAGTTQTARDLGASVLLSSGTGAGQVSLSSGTVTVGTNNDKTGYSLLSTGLDAIAQSATGMVEIAKAVWDRVLTGATHNIASSAGKRMRQISQAASANSGTAQAGGSTTITLEAGASAVNDFYTPGLIVIEDGTGAVQYKRIESYDGSTKIATVSTAWAVNPDATSVYTIQPWGSVRVTNIDNGAAADIRAAIGMANADLDSQLGGILADTAEIGTAGAGLTALGDTRIANLDEAVSTRLATAGYTAPPSAATNATAVRSELTTELGRIDVATSTRLASASYTAADNAGITAIKAKTDNLPASPAATGDIPSAAVVADAVWDEATAGHTTAGTTGKALTDAGSAGDPWTTILPGAYGAGTAGKIVGDALDAAISTRLAAVSYTAPDNVSITAILEDTAELQAEWADGGRLDLILDARASQLSVDSVVVVINKLDTMLEPDGPVSRYTANSLELSASVSMIGG